MYIALMITMLLGGIWHGAAWTFFVWGALHGIYLITERLLKNFIKIKIGPWNGILLALATYTCVNFTWVFFRAREFSTAKNMISSMLFMNPEGAKILDNFSIIKVFTVVTGLFLCHWFMRNKTVYEVAHKNSPWLVGTFWAIMIFLMTIAQGSGEQFIYFQF
jgi:alginate O-acetyltransferase complex protein AlgI